MPQLEAIEIPNVDDLKAEGAVILTGAKTCVIKTKNEYANAGEFLRRVSRFKDDVKRRFEKVKKAANALHKSITEAENEELAPALEAERVVKRGMSDYLVEEDRQRRLEQARLQEEERKKAEVAKAAEVDALDRAGDTEAAVALLDRPVAVTAVELEKPKAEGVSYRSSYKFEVIDPKLVTPPYMTPDLKKIQSVVDGLKLEAAAAIGGIKVWEEKVIVARR